MYTVVAYLIWREKGKPAYFTLGSYATHAEAWRAGTEAYSNGRYSEMEYDIGILDDDGNDLGGD